MGTGPYRVQRWERVQRITLVKAESPALIDRVERYLTQLAARTAALLATGMPLSEVADAADLPEFATDDHHDTTHRRNASIVFLRQERALMLGTGTRTSPN